MSGGTALAHTRRIERVRHVHGNYNARMLALRYVYVLALVVWLGGIIVLGAIVAPATFQVLQTSDRVSGRALAGDVFGTIVARFHYVEYAAGAALLLALLAMALLGPRPRGFAVRTGLVALMLAGALYSGIVVLGRMNRIQQEVAAPVSGLSTDDPRRVRFDQLHQLATRLMMLNMAIGLALLYWEARED